MKLKILMLVLTSLVLTACGRAPEIDRTRAVGYETALGQSLTKTKWCTPASTDGVNHPNFSTLDFRQSGKFFRSTYTLGDEQDLKLEGKEQGTWSLILDKLFTQVEGRERKVEAKVTVVEDTGANAAVSAKTSTNVGGEQCLRLAVFGADDETFCPCNFVNN